MFTHLQGIFNFKITIFWIICLILIQQAFANKSECFANKEVCEWTKKVVAIKTPTMIASGVILSNNLIVTNRHVIEDSEFVLVKMPNKKIQKAYSIANDHVADIAFLSLIEKIPEFDINIKDVFVCVHSDNDLCNCPKPKPALFYIDD